jgi:ABC-type multidrug transport system fused ATPase/permease subunit
MYGAFDRLDELLKAPQEKKVIEKVRASSITQGVIEFQDVGFSYPQGFQLHNVNLFIKAGETVAIVGPNGSGKTTLLSLIPRFLEADKGTIRIDGLDVKEYSVHGLRRDIAFVFQEPVLFYGTLLENLSFAKPEASVEDVFAAARAAHVEDFALKLPDGYETQIGQYGSNLSVGQRQRISIARALLKDPKILIMDEPTSALDAESDFLITDSLSLLMKNRTTIIVSHRVSTIRTADRIVLMDRGRLAECDTHPESLEAKGLHLVQA